MALRFQDVLPGLRPSGGPVIAAWSAGGTRALGGRPHLDRRQVAAKEQDCLSPAVSAAPPRLPPLLRAGRRDSGSPDPAIQTTAAARVVPRRQLPCRSVRCGRRPWQGQAAWSSCCARRRSARSGKGWGHPAVLDGHAAQQGPRLPAAIRARPEGIRANLVDRLDEAKEQGWLDEVAAIETTLAAAAQKLDAMHNLTAKRTSTHLGMPDVRPSAGRRSPGS